MNPRPSDSELSTIYPPQYHAYNLKKDGKKDSFNPVMKIVTTRAKVRFQAMVQSMNLMDRQDPINVLDVGCGDGTYLDQWKDLIGVHVQTYGVEISEEVAARAEASGHQVLTGRFEDVSLPEGSFDLIVSSHVIEHVSDPLAFMTKIRSLLKPNGTAVIDTPATAGLCFSIFGKSGHWGGFHTPRHWNLFDQNSFSQLGQQAGFDIQRFEFVPINIFWIWSLHSFFYPRWPALADLLFHPVKTIVRGGPWDLINLVLAQVLEKLSLMITGKTGQMRIFLRPRN